MPCDLCGLQGCPACCKEARWHRLRGAFDDGYAGQREYEATDPQEIEIWAAGEWWAIFETIFFVEKESE